MFVLPVKVLFLQKQLAQAGSFFADFYNLRPRACVIDMFYFDLSIEKCSMVKLAPEIKNLPRRKLFITDDAEAGIAHVQDPARKPVTSGTQLRLQACAKTRFTA